MTKAILNLSIWCFLFISSISIYAQERTDNKSTKFFVKPYAGFIGVQDMTIELVDQTNQTSLEVENGFGYATGVSFGYTFYKNITAELGWEYKSNQITISDGINSKIKGDYASNFIYLNGVYSFNTESKFTPYLAGGVSVIEEIDMDLGDDTGNSFSNSGQIGWQVIAGLDYKFASKWSLNWEAKYVSFGEFSMDNETNSSSLKKLKYNPFIFNIGLKYRF